MNKVSTILDRSGNLLNKIMAFLVGIFCSAIFFIFMLKMFNAIGIVLSLLVSFVLYFMFRKAYHKSDLLKPFNIGLLAFNIITIVVGLVLYFGVNSFYQGVAN